ncbi:MAG: hypothetical protein GXO88_11930 [Chlorobi bacterium]|nr:hypothetical protein [Chlorobiota bacterium]
MIYPRNFEQKLGFDSIRDLIKENCVSPMGITLADNIRFSSNTENIKTLLSQTQEFIQIIDFGKSFPANNYFDLRHELTRLKLEGTYIEKDSLFDLKSSLTAISDIILFFKKSEAEDYPELIKLCGRVFIPDGILSACDKIIDDKGGIRDTASRQLLEIRNKLIVKSRQVLKETKKAFDQAKNQAGCLKTLI